MYKSSFKKFGGEFIPNIVDYLKEYIKNNQNVTISVGVDSIQRRRKTVYAVTIGLYDTDVRNGSHVVFFRKNLEKVRNHFERLQKEAEFALDVADFLNEELSPFYERTDITEKERKRYKFHLERCAGNYNHIALMNEEAFINNLSLDESEKIKKYKLVDIHVDYNPSEGHIDKKGNAKNKSNASYKSMVPYLRSLDYRVFAKPLSFSATSAADLLLQD
jgi:predicted RNase H-related nuclease YkuK (DUF458 family)